MSMTHYMALLADNQPWNLLLFMAIPVILAETIAITELYVLSTRNVTGIARRINRFASIIAGIYFAGVFVYLMITAVLPLTLGGEWRGIADVLAVGFYLVGVVPLLGLTLLELGFIKRSQTEEEKLKLHAFFVALFLVVAHVAMVFGMLDPQVLGWTAETEGNVILHSGM
jgi:hypothetical protein